MITQHPQSATARRPYKAAESGSAMLEFVFVVPVLVIMALGVFDFSFAIQRAMAVQAAAHTGTDYGSSEGYFYNTTAMQSYAVASQPQISGLAAAAATYCSCTPGGTVINCSSFCNTNELPLQYAIVLTTASPPILFRYTGFPITISVGGKSVRRIR